MNKLQVTLILAVIISGAQFCRAVQNSTDTDKPERLYRYLDTKAKSSTFHETVSFTDQSGNSAILKTKHSDQISSTCENAKPGFGQEQFNEQADNWDWQGQHSYWTISVDSQMTWFSDMSPMTPMGNRHGTQISTTVGTYSDGSTSSDTSTNMLGWPPFGDEHCIVSDPYSISSSGYVGVGQLWEEYDFDETYTRSAQTIYHLQTGGKSLPHRNTLWILSGVAYEISGKRALPIAADWIRRARSIAATNISVGGYTLKTNGIFYTTLPDGEDLNMTPEVSGIDYYAFGAGADKYPLHVIANGRDLSVTNLELCVGQGVTFSTEWQTSYNSGPRGLVDTSAHWHLPGKFVNETYPYSSACTSYRVNYDLLTNLTTSCWYYNKPGGTASIGMNLHFSNGQYVSIAAEGDFTVYRPSVNPPVLTGPFRADIVRLGSVLWLELINNPMYFSVRINSAYSGSFGITQLVNMSSQTALAPFIFIGSSTFGEFNLDESPSEPGEYYSGVNDIASPSQIDDPPGQPLVYAVGNYNGHWKDYVRFTPSGGIPITLERLDWNWAAAAYYDEISGWSIDSDGEDGPNPYNDDTFPLWKHTGIYPVAY